MAGSYEPREYWDQRLGRNFSEKGVGHQDYDDAYNRWLFKAKADALDRALGNLQEGAQALDVGSGIGWVVDQLLQRGLAVEGCDIADVAVDQLTGLYPAAEFFQAAIGTDPLPRDPDTYDVVTMLDVAYHITDDRLWEAAIADLARVLKPEGKLIITDKLGEGAAVPAAHVRFRSEGQWQTQIARHGLIIGERGVLFRRLSRPHDLRGWKRLPDGTRGGVEYVLDRLGTGEPTLHWAVLRAQ